MGRLTQHSLARRVCQGNSYVASRLDRTGTVPAMDIRYDTEVAGFHVRLPNRSAVVPALAEAELAAWQRASVHSVVTTFDSVRQTLTPPPRHVREGLAALAPIVDALDATHEVLVSAVVAYDRTGALGGRAWIEKHMTEQQVRRLFRELTDHGSRP